MRILAVDHGSRHIGLAVSDPTGTIARPLKTLLHVSRLVDAASVAEVAREQEAGLIIVGLSLDDSGQPNAAGRSAVRFAEAIHEQTKKPVVFWDEAFTTQEARGVRLRMGSTRKKRSGHLDSLAAAILLQSYLDREGRS